jgi:hypothetical protein
MHEHYGLAVSERPPFHHSPWQEGHGAMFGQRVDTAYFLMCVRCIHGVINGQSCGV